MDSFVETLRRELAALERELEADPRHRKIARIKALLAEYDSPTPVMTMQVGNVSIPIRKRPPPEGDTKRARIHRVVGSNLLDGERVHRRDLLTALQADGLLVDDKDPMGALAAYLSSFPDFQSAGGGFWELTPPDDAEASTSEPMEAS